MEELKGEGTAWVTYKCEEDGREAYTYYYLGDGIKVVYFSDDDEDIIYYRMAQQAALQRLTS